jgi:ABC-type amino acid transport substrate-binding protein
MEKDSIDAFVSLLKTSEREKYMCFIEPPIRTKLKFVTYVNNMSNFVIDHMEDLDGLKVALMGGSYSCINKDTLINKKIIGPDISEGFNLLFNDSVDVVHIVQWLAMWFLQDGKYTSNVKLTPYSYSEFHPIYLVMSRKSNLTPKYAVAFGHTIKEMIEDGTMKRIIDSYVPGWYE